MHGVLQVCSKKWIYAAYVLIWFVTFTNSLQQAASNTWAPYVTSSFELHGLTGITEIASGVVGGVLKLPLAKFINLIGRPEGFLISLVAVVVSLGLMALSQNVATYCTAQVFYWSGINGISYVLDIFVMDTAKLQNMAIYLGFTSMPYIFNALIGPEIGEVFLLYVPSTWRWGYGVFTIITVVMCAPMWVMFFLMVRKAKRAGNIEKREKGGRTLGQNVAHWCNEFDAVGLFLLCTGLSVFLIPFSLSSYQRDGFKSPLFISMVLVGPFLLVAFALYEKFWAPKSFLPVELMKDRSNLAACLLGFNSWIAFYSYKRYFNSYLQVVFQRSVAEAGYITNVYNIVSCAWSIVIGGILKVTNRYKWVAVVSVPIQILMTGLMIHFRKPNSPLNALIVVEVFSAICGANFFQVTQVAIRAAVPDKDIDVAVAILLMFSAVGGALGQAVCAAIWTHVVPVQLEKHLPEDRKNEAARIYGSLDVQLEYAWESPERQAVVRAFGDAQKVMVIVGTCALAPCFVWAFMLRDYRLAEVGEGEGNDRRV
ncbi:siderophore iron transporter mirB [Lentithecium fluviatile CBS 122367]|uniref:Siderophore iron transporter mirB n=1 Tax=Lentithecium fluviatile CBS 122367 TaxID=1168545 RepID=A0A6G1IYK2_9PLEO|nr:siderophore iron transporter mirB [Lentithecium fluviatile CBS 122367]